ncbi:MAG TPA: TonB-dependent receptor [Vicinamibacterales bacterium]|nr:TonB-dependent receptor [Vicinamibacterales bacterium]
MEPAFSVGGPIARNRAWFFGAYQPALTKTERAVSTSSAANPSAGTFDEDQKDTSHYVTANVNSQISNNLRGRISYNNSWRRLEGLLPAQAGTDASGTDYSKTQTFPNWNVGGNLDWVTSPRLFFGIKGGYRFADVNDSNVPEIPRLIFSTGNNLSFPEVPVNLQRSSGFQNIPSNSKITRDQQTRLYFQADGTLYGNAGGAHQIKFGFQYDRLGNDVLSGESANLIRLRWNTPLVSGDPTTRGAYGYYQVRSNGVAPKQGLITEGNIHMNVFGLFIQDTWTINNKLTVNLGIRTEQEKVPTYTTGDDIPEFGLEFPFSQKIAPRVGFAYDVKGDGRWKVFGSWGTFYDIFKLELPRGSFGGDKWLEYYYTLDSFDWQQLITTVGSSANCPPACPGRLIRGPVDFRHPSFGSDAIDPDIKPMKMQEATAGVEHQLSDLMALSVRYVHKQIDRAIEDTGSLDAQGNEIYVIANPGEGLTELAHPGVAMPLPVRDYDSVEFAFDKRMSNNWYLRASYLWSRLYGNYSGLSQSDENGRTSPNVGRLYDYPMMMFKDGGEPVYGPLPTDRPHQFKTQFIYQFNFGTSLGLNQYVASGLPVTREIGIYPPNTLPVQYLGRGSDGRTPMFSQTDLFVQHSVRLGDRNVQMFVNVLNLFNQKTATSKFSTYQYSGGVIPNEDAFYAGRQTLASQITAQNVARDPRFLMDSAFQSALQARIGVKFTF